MFYLQAHLTSSEGRAHNPDLVMSYPMKNQFVLCPKCTKVIFTFVNNIEN